MLCIGGIKKLKLGSRRGSVTYIIQLYKYVYMQVFEGLFVTDDMYMVIRQRLTELKLQCKSVQLFSHDHHAPLRSY